MARRFPFRLKTVQRLREQARDAQRRVVAEKVRQVGTVEQHIAAFTGELDRAVGESRDSQAAARIDIAAVRDQHRYRGWLRRRMGDSFADWEVKQRELFAEQAGLIEASKRLRVIEKLRDRQWREYQAEVRREEQAATDEAAASQFLRCERRNRLNKKP
jgi:flagellar export protein FliJ